MPVIIVFALIFAFSAIFSFQKEQERRINSNKKPRNGFLVIVGYLVFYWLLLFVFTALGWNELLITFIPFVLFATLVIVVIAYIWLKAESRKDSPDSSPEDD